MATLTLKQVLFAFLLPEITGQLITVPVELHTTVDLPCSCPICPDSTVAVQWYRSSNSESDDVFKQDGKALAWWYEGETGSSQGFGIKDDFSMIWNSVNLTNGGLYRCIVTLYDGAECSHDARLGIYANPDTSPVIKYIQQTNGFKVTCSISNVFPMTFPILTSKEGNGTAYINRNITDIRDGTFNTTVTRLFSPIKNKKDTTIECLYSNLNFRSRSSLHILYSDTIDQPEDKDTMEKNTTLTDIDYKGRFPGFWMVWLILIMEVLLFIVIIIVYVIKFGRVIVDLRKTKGNSTDDVDRDEHRGKNSEEEGHVKCKKILQLFSKPSCGVAMLTIQIAIVLILLVAYIATVIGK